MRFAPEKRSEIKEAIKSGMKVQEVVEKFGISVPTFYVMKREMFGPARKQAGKTLAKRGAKRAAPTAQGRGRSLMPAVEVIPIKKIPTANGHIDIVSQMAAQMKGLKKTNGLVVRNCGLPDYNKLKKQFGKKWKVLRTKKSAYRGDCYIWQE